MNEERDPHKKGLQTIISMVGEMQYEIEDTKESEEINRDSINTLYREKTDLSKKYAELKSDAAALRESSEKIREQSKVTLDMIAKKNNECKDLLYGTTLMQTRIDKLETKVKDQKAEIKKLKAKKK